jgi:F0F1-type ATP synthase membrane subunit b/b'
MIGAGTIISPIIKIITTVAILAAIYFFFVKPALDTTESISSNISDSIDESFDNFDTFTPDVKQSVRKAQKLQEQAQQSSSQQIAQAEKLLNCISNAGSDVDKMSACNAKFSP